MFYDLQLTGIVRLQNAIICLNATPDSEAKVNEIQITLVKLDFRCSFCHVNILCKRSICFVLLSLDCGAKFQQLVWNWLICSLENVDQATVFVSKHLKNRVEWNLRP